MGTREDAESTSRHTAYMREWRKKNPKNAEDNRRWAKESSLRQEKELGHPKRRIHRPRDPLKAKASHAINHELHMGRMVRPDTCESCGESPESMRDGRTSIQAHHDDYHKPLDVRWLCVSCHGKEHRKWQ